MSSKYIVIAVLYFIVGIIGVDRTIYWFLLFATCILGFVVKFHVVYVKRYGKFFKFSFVIHLIIHKKIWLKSNPIHDHIQTTFIRSKIADCVRKSCLFSRIVFHQMVVCMQKFRRESLK